MRNAGRLLDWSDRGEAPGTLETRIFESEGLSFHPKAYLFASSRSAPHTTGEAFVGSSNLSGSGLAGGIEWNVATVETALLSHAFARLWDDPRCRPLTRAWLADYARRAPDTPPSPHDRQHPDLTAVREPPPAAPTPRAIQAEALQALERTRAAGFSAGLVVMATGLGKTWLAAFDSARGPYSRILFIAHREEILRQSRAVFRRVHPRADMGLLMGPENDTGADILFASIQTLARRLDSLPPDRFDYIVVDEFHHAAATSYRRVIDHFRPAFLLGLTATPERMDGADLLALCGENLVFTCDLVEGIRRRDLVPSVYHGIRDVADFEPIPWRNGRFDPEALTRAVETRERARQALDHWRDKGGSRTLAFCCSTTHADFMAAFFRAEGVRAAAVHSRPTSAPRRASIARLRHGELEVLFAVDIFNEGLDVSDIDTVLMLRPTESPVVFLQQLGRGLRPSLGKERLVVVDFIGNHRSFLIKPRTLLSLGRRRTPTTRSVLRAVRTSEFDLPEGCRVSYDLEIYEMLRTLARIGRKEAIEDFCLTHVEETGMRPSAAQAFRAGLNPSSVRRHHGGWFGFLGELGLLSEAEAAALDDGRPFLEALEFVLRTTENADFP